MAHIKQSTRPDSGLRFQVKYLKPLSHPLFAGKRPLGLVASLPERGVVIRTERVEFAVFSVDPLWGLKAFKLGGGGEITIVIPPTLLRWNRQDV